MEKGAPIPTVITAYKDRSFDFVTKKPPVTFYLKKAAKIKKGCQTPGRSKLGKVTMKQVEDIAKEKMKDLNAHDINEAVKIIAGSARSSGGRGKRIMSSKRFKKLPEKTKDLAAETFEKLLPET